ncbi:hypothetical protein VaNZ11_011903 [Volvox africanus]|uniref:Poly A polymerase head domain-containing protein n=1 Tax=Volvox africanus TaxID=51714 RepID=A0ABQ5SDY3_9CHLO|nr:hypothetical protein VaNZ11_011903 [Volvox africanus]
MLACSSAPVSIAVLIGSLHNLQRACWVLCNGSGSPIQYTGFHPHAFRDSLYSHSVFATSALALEQPPCAFRAAESSSATRAVAAAANAGYPQAVRYPHLNNSTEASDSGRLLPRRCNSASREASPVVGNGLTSIQTWLGKSWSKAQLHGVSEAAAAVKETLPSKGTQGNGSGCSGGRGAVDDGRSNTSGNAGSSANAAASIDCSGHSNGNNSSNSGSSSGSNWSRYRHGAHSNDDSCSSHSSRGAGGIQKRSGKGGGRGSASSRSGAGGDSVHDGNDPVGVSVGSSTGSGGGGLPTASLSRRSPPPPPLSPSGPLAIRHFPNFTLVLHRLPPLSTPRSLAEQRCLGAALGVVNRLRSHGYTAMFAGGWVRDQFLGRPSADIDLVTNATTVQIFDVFGPRQCKLKGGNTCDVTLDGIAFEVTTYRGGLHDDCEEAEWRDAACRDFTINALFFDPKLPPPQHYHQSSPSTSTFTSSWPLLPLPPLSDSSQPAGVVKDYVGGVVDIRTGQLRVFRNHQLLGNTASSVEMDPLRVFRAARLSVEMGLRLDPYTEDRVRRAAAKCVLRQNGVTGNRVYRELSKMNDLDKNCGSGSGGGGNGNGLCAGGGGGGGGHPSGGTDPQVGVLGTGGCRGSRFFAAALEKCREWRALEALFPRLPQEHLKRVISTVITTLPVELPLELKLSCLVVVAAGGSGELMPWNVAERYEPITSLLSEARQSQFSRHYPDLLCTLSELLLTDYTATQRQEEWARFLAAEGSEKVEVALEAFMPRNWQRQLREKLGEHRTALAPIIATLRSRKSLQMGAARGAGIGNMLGAVGSGRPALADGTGPAAAAAGRLGQGVQQQHHHHHHHQVAGEVCR